MLGMTQVPQHDMATFKELASLFTRYKPVIAMEIQFLAYEKARSYVSQHCKSAPLTGPRAECVDYGAIFSCMELLTDIVRSECNDFLLQSWLIVKKWAFGNIKDESVLAELGYEAPVPQLDSKTQEVMARVNGVMQRSDSTGAMATPTAGEVLREHYEKKAAKRKEYYRAYYQKNRTKILAQVKAREQAMAADKLKAMRKLKKQKFRHRCRDIINLANDMAAKDPEATDAEATEDPALDDGQATSDV